MIVGAVVEAFIGVDAEQKSLRAHRRAFILQL